MTIVEILFALAIITLVLVTAYTASIKAWQSAVEANHRTEAQYLAQNALEGVKGYRNLTDAPVSSQSFDWSGSGGFLDKITTTYSGSGFLIEPCALVVPDDTTCEWKYAAGPKDMKVAGDDATTFKVTVKLLSWYCAGSAAVVTTTPCGTYADYKAVNLQATVTWPSIENASQENNAIASTILTGPE